jgi:hypothetical protein
MLQQTLDSPDKTGISLIRINNEREMRKWNVDELSHELWGNDCPRQYPVYLIFYHGHAVGYFLAIQQMVVYPALHPERLHPREFLKITRSLITEFKRMTGNPLFMLCKKDAEFGAKNMRRVRLKRAEENAYIFDEEAE